MRSSRSWFSTLIVVALLTSANALATLQYTIVDLGASGEAYSINDSGQVAGRLNGRAFLWENGAMRDLGTLPGCTNSTGNGVNDLRMVAGGSYATWGQHAFLWEDDIMIDLGTLEGHSISTADAVNNLGQVVGESVGATHSAYLYDSGEMISLGTLGGDYSNAHDINDRGQIVGTSKITTGDEHAFLWSQEEGMIDLGTLGGNRSNGHCINELGQVAGRSRISNGDEHAFLWENDAMVDLGTLGGNRSAANGINESGQIVGRSYTAAGYEHAFLYSNGIMVDLNDILQPGDSAWELQVAYDINCNGQIVGYGMLDGQVHAFLMVPELNTPPVVTADQPAIIVDEGEVASNTGTVSDADGDSVILSASVGTVTNNGNDTWFWSFPATDGPSESQNATITADDGQGGVAEATFGLIVNNVPPSVDTISVPVIPTLLGTPVSANATFSDPAGVSDVPYSCTFDYADGTGVHAGTISDYTCSGPDHTYASPGVYTVTITVADKDGGSDSTQTNNFIVIYDPSSGFVTGGGWIHSPQGAYAADTSLTGKATFGFVSKYKKGATVPTGQTQFSFRVADLNFHSTSYEWLVVAGPKAMFKGTGTINSAGDYGFMLSAIDGEINGGGGIDKFRIKIWDKDSSDVIMYDNQMEAEENADPTTAIGGGSIVIHGDPKAAPELLPKETCLLNAYPNPFNPDVWIPYRLSSHSEVVIRIHDMTGRLARTLDMGYQPAGIYVSKSKAAHWDGANESGERVASGIYFYTLKAGDFSATRKMVVRK